MKTTITLTVDGDRKEEAMRIVQSRGGSLSFLFNKFLEEFLQENDGNQK